MFSPSFKGFHEGQSGFPFIPEGFRTIQRQHKDLKNVGRRKEYKVGYERDGQLWKSIITVNLNQSGTFVRKTMASFALEHVHMI